jgi:hypothetical protein
MSTTPNEVTAKTAGEPNAILSKVPDLVDHCRLQLDRLVILCRLHSSTGD